MLLGMSNDTFITHYFQKKSDTEPLKEVITRWLVFSEVNTKRLISAGVTSKYWNDCHAKLIVRMFFILASRKSCLC